MRYTEILITEAAEPRHRLWIGPAGQVVHCDDDVSHSRYVVAHAADFGIAPGYLESLEEFWDENDEQFDYNYVLALAEQSGWVRVSRDGADEHSVRISGASVPHILKATQWLVDQGYRISGLEMDKIVGKTVQTRYFTFDEDALNRFLQSRRLPVASASNVVPVLLP